jgi:hypothetical protein
MSWRTEADDDWLPSHRSNVMRWLRRRFRGIAPVGDAFSWADTGPYAGAPRNPRLRADEGAKKYSTVRYATHTIAYTATVTTTDQDRCRRCGEPLAETHQLRYVRDGVTPEQVGAVRTCHGCQADSWLFGSKMPSARRARARARRNVV